MDRFGATAKVLTVVTASQDAPGDLESVRELLNSWSIPNDVRVPVDRFDEFARAQRVKPARERRHLRALRDDLRAVVEGAAVTRLNPWIVRLKMRPLLAEGEVRLAFEGGGAIAGKYLAAVLRAVDDGTWGRLKSCPDCRWVFFDHTRNGTKRWCLMNAGSPTGRACGTNAKVRRFRERKRLEGESES
jgi:predicted RNA-binding Zn ribbon-like protein